MHKLSVIVIAAAAAVYFAVMTASASVLVQESFLTGEGGYTSGGLAPQGMVTAGFSADSKWGTGNTTTASHPKVFTTGLGLPADELWAGFSCGGVSVGYNNNKNTAYRAAERKLNDGAIPSSGRFYIRALMQQSAGTGENTERGDVRGVGFRPVALGTSYGAGNGEKAAVIDSGVWFAFRKTSSGTELILKAGGAESVLVQEASFSEGTTYLCVAEVDVGESGAASKGFAVPVDRYRGVANYGDSIESAALTSSTPLKYMMITGPYGAGAKSPIYFDEIVVGMELADVVPVAETVDNNPEIGTVSQSADGDMAVFSVELVTPAFGGDVETSVSVEYSTTDDFASKETVALVETQAGSRVYSGSASGIVAGTTYYYRAVASAEKDGETVSTASDVLSFVHLTAGHVYVSPDGTAVLPYSTPETAAKTPAAAYEIAGDGATIHVLSGIYSANSQLQVERAVSIIGEGAGVGDVVMCRNEQGGAQARVLMLNNANALVANMTISGGRRIDANKGSNVYLNTGGGTVSNCVIAAGTHDGGIYDSGCSGVYISSANGVVTHCVFSNNTVTTQSDSIWGSCIHAANGGRIDNCLFIDNGTSANVPIVYAGGSATVENCTVVRSVLGYTATGEETLRAAPIYASAGANVRNCVFAGVVDGNGEALPPLPADAANRARFTCCAFDTAVLPEGVGEKCITGTAESFFVDYANGDLRPGVALRNKGSETSAATDLAGRSRLFGRAPDIGCYEAHTVVGMSVVIR